MPVTWTLVSAEAIGRMICGNVVALTLMLRDVLATQDANPAAWMVSVYVPGGTAAKLKKPEPLEALLYFEPLAAFCRTTLAFGITAPLASVTVPLIVPLADWAWVNLGAKYRRETLTPITIHARDMRLHMRWTT